MGDNAVGQVRAHASAPGGDSVKVAFRAPELAQIAMNTKDMPRSVELLAGVLGFRDGRGEVLWGERLGRLHEVGSFAACFIWWLSGRQEFSQLELFQHTNPAQRSLPADWRASDHGWVRWGFATDDLDGARVRLAEYDAPATDIVDLGDGVRRFCFRDPYVGTFIEVIEDGPGLLGGPRSHHFEADPAIVYATVSVPDLDLAREFWVEAMGMAEVDREALHPPEAESLWGLEPGSAEGFLLDGGGRHIEVVHYADGRPASPDRKLSDQGLMNVAVGYRDRPHFDALLERLAAAGVTPVNELGTGPVPAAYCRAPDGTSVEIVAVSAEYDATLGLCPRPDGDLKEKVHG